MKVSIGVAVKRTGFFFFCGQVLWGFGVVEERGVEGGWLDFGVQRRKL